VPLLYQALVVTPILLYFGFVFPDWTWMYLVDPHRLPIGITILFALATGAALLGGYLGGWSLLRARRRRELSILVALGGALLIVGMVLLRGRLGHAGTYAEYVGGHAARLVERKLGWSLLLCSAGLVAGLVLSLRFLVLQGRREREG
jgi:hypothetical protein